MLIADEPTTALDRNHPSANSDLLNDLQQETQMSIILITHDLGVVARMADEVMVMYAGQVVEHGSVDDVFYRSAHPYTLGLRGAMPSNRRSASQTLVPIDGSPPDLFQPPQGCGYCARCPHAMKICGTEPPSTTTVNSNHWSRCWLHDNENPNRPETLYFAAGAER